MKTIAICNLKGGVAKTTTTVNVAAILAKEHHKRVLVIDADSQANTTHFFHVNAEKTLADLLRLPKIERTVFSIAVLSTQMIKETEIKNLSVLPADSTLMDLDLTKVESDAVYIDCIKHLTQTVMQSYDYCLIDCPPAFNAASTAALLAADEVLIPVKLDAFALEGMANLMQQIHNMRTINRKLVVRGLLPVMWYRHGTIIDAEQTLRKSTLPVFHHIRSTPKVDVMTWAQQPLIFSSPRCGACCDYRRLVGDLLEGGA